MNYSSIKGATVSNGSLGFFKQIQDSKWFDQLQVIINLANLIVERIEESSSVMLSLEDGWDLTCQVSSLSQLLLDPYYRTIEGFCVLIEREWLSMGHRFSRRSNQTVDDQTGFSPLFLQFLDVVYQCLSQNPVAFEFNEFYLEFLAYHYVSNRFKTFLLDSELERLKFGILSELNKKQDNSSSFSYSLANSISSNTTCIWQYILKVHYNSAKFFNFNYQPNICKTLRPSAELYKLKLWRYYTKETLCTGPVYDLDLTTIGNLNQISSSSTSGGQANVSCSSISQSKIVCNDEFWYPVPIQNANDYYEQLDQIIPTQYELLIKQIIRKYKLTDVHDLKIKSPSINQNFENISNTSLSKATSDFLKKVLNAHESSNDNESNLEARKKDGGINQFIPLNWKNVWDYFYQMVIIFTKKSFIQILNVVFSCESLS
jgi:hypothetical protein